MASSYKHSTVCLSVCLSHFVYALPGAIFSDHGETWWGHRAKIIRSLDSLNVNELINEFDLPCPVYALSGAILLGSNLVGAHLGLSLGQVRSEM